MLLISSLAVKDFVGCLHIHLLGEISMSLGDFRAIYLPYCIEQNIDGTWVVLNRQYKPVGFNTNDYIRYEEFPVFVRLRGLGPATLKRISYDGQVKGSCVYLYNDGTNLLNGPNEMKAYLKRIEILAKLSVSD